MKTKHKSLLFVLVVSIITLFFLGNNQNTKGPNVSTGVDVKVYQGGIPVENAFIRVSGNGFEECCYTSGSGKCRIQVPQDGYYGFCASKDHYGDSKTVYISGGTMEVYLYLNTYGLECQSCQNPEKH
jgi:hypothetical protein